MTEYVCLEPGCDWSGDRQEALDHEKKEGHLTIRDSRDPLDSYWEENNDRD